MKLVHHLFEPEFQQHRLCSLRGEFIGALLQRSDLVGILSGEMHSVTEELSFFA